MKKLVLPILLVLSVLAAPTIPVGSVNVANARQNYEMPDHQTEGDPDTYGTAPRGQLNPMEGSHRSEFSGPEGVSKVGLLLGLLKTLFRLLGEAR